ncbi:hypothetical protein IGI04_024474 [Brassica rapa subsp. trilocularis]|uniref:Uncharacterized protein n=1 Tax=Brassica rapa subsp. trilocularis TaxID=1813537 RepID=A0ABQ7M983_BRACM|nr:hypothetical protein IGI04_024474 [Brassica rapa subsp. trilocularis]
MGSGTSEIRLRHIRLQLLGCVLGLVNARTPRFLKRLASHAATYNTRTEKTVCDIIMGKTQKKTFKNLMQSWLRYK